MRSVSPHKAWKIQQGPKVLDVILLPAYLEKWEVIRRVKEWYPENVQIHPYFLGKAYHEKGN